MGASSVICVTGGTGFIGRRLAEIAGGGIRLRVLTRRPPPDPSSGGVEWVRGDLRDLASLSRFLRPEAALINLAYLQGTPQENLAAASNLVDACARIGVRNIVHCSTAVVVGDAPEDLVDEATPCRPVSEYERTKLAIEKIFLERAPAEAPLSILRPTLVFGPRGLNLRKIVGELADGGAVGDFIRRSMYGARRLNLVGVDNVVAALLFLAETAPRRECFIVSDDEFPENNYADVAERVAQRLRPRGRILPALSVPPAILGAALRLAGRSNRNPRRNYHAGKLASWGYRKPKSFIEALDEYLDWQRGRSAAR